MKNTIIFSYSGFGTGNLYLNGHKAHTETTFAKNLAHKLGLEFKYFDTLNGGELPVDSAAHKKVDIVEMEGIAEEASLCGIGDKGTLGKMTKSLGTTWLLKYMPLSFG